MNYEQKILEIDNILSELKNLKADYLKTKKLSEKSLNTDFRTHSPKQIQKAATDLNWQCMHLDKNKKRVWKLILNADLEVDLGETEYRPSEFHNYK